MGLSPYSSPSDAGILCMILVQTAMSISFMKQNLLSILHVVWIRMPSNQPATATPEPCLLTTYMDEFRSQTPTIRFDSLSCTTKQDCSVCLTEFKPDSNVNRLSCGHVFHKTCLEKWLNYWNLTCPLCRNRVMGLEKTQENTSSM